MTKEETEKKLSKYTERHRFWNEQVLSHFGYSLNLFTTIGIGFLGYLISTRDKYPTLQIDTSLTIDWALLFYILSIIIVFFSIIMGSISIISRLYDLRLTRHLIFARRITFEKLNKLLPDSFIDLRKESLVKTFINILFCKLDFIKDPELEKFDEIKSKFEILRKKSKILGRISWRMHKVQILFLVLSVLIYSLTILK